MVTNNDDDDGDGPGRRPEMLAPSDALARKARAHLGLDEAALALAEKAAEAFIEENRGDFGREEIAAMRQTFGEIKASPDDPRPAIKSIYQQAHDLRGMGKTYGFDLLTQMGDSLCAFIQSRATWSEKELETVRVHIDSMKLVVEKQVTGAGGDWGAGLMKRLSDYVAEHGTGPGKEG